MLPEHSGTVHARGHEGETLALDTSEQTGYKDLASSVKYGADLGVSEILRRSIFLCFKRERSINYCSTFVSTPGPSSDWALSNCPLGSTKTYNALQ